jgi:hypothetical protein
MAQRWAMHTSLCPGGGGKALPLTQHCTSSVHEEATLPCVSCLDNNVIVAVSVAIAIAIAVAVSIAVVVAIAIAVGRPCCHWPLPLLLQVAIAIPAAIPITVTIAIAIAIAVSASRLCCHCHCKRHLPPEKEEAFIGELLPWRSNNYILTF